MQCRLEAGDGRRSEVTVAVTGVEDDEIQFDIEAVEPAEQPEGATDSVGQGVVGDRVTITLGGVDAGDVMLESVTSRTTPTDAEFGEPPAKGTYWTVTVVVNALPGQAFDINPLDFYLRDEAGNRWDAFDGNAIFESTDNDLPATDLNAGERVRGTIVFDAPATATELVYAPELDALFRWKLV